MCSDKSPLFLVDLRSLSLLFRSAVMHDHSLPPPNKILMGNSSLKFADRANVLVVCNNTLDLHCTFKAVNG